MDIKDLQKGDLLHSSCSDEIYGRISYINLKNNTIDISDVSLYDLDSNDIISDAEFSCQDDYYRNDKKIVMDEKKYLEYLNFIEKTKCEVVNVKIDSIKDSLFDFKIKGYTPIASIVLNTPGNDCFRCTKLFTVLREK